MTTTTNFSIYIPSIRQDTTVKDITDEFRFANLGEVLRVDFTPIVKKRGFAKPIGEQIYKSAFVHFSVAAPHLIAGVQNETYKFYYPQHCYRNCYWILLENFAPIETTHMNIHQVVDNCRFLEEKVEEQDKTIESLRQYIHYILADLNTVKNVLHNMADANDNVDVPELESS